MQLGSSAKSFDLAESKMCADYFWWPSFTWKAALTNKRGYIDLRSRDGTDTNRHRQGNRAINPAGAALLTELAVGAVFLAVELPLNDRIRDAHRQYGMSTMRDLLFENAAF